MNPKEDTEDDEFVYTVASRNQFMRKIFDFLPKGSFKLVYHQADNGVYIELLESKSIIVLELNLTWIQIKKLLTKHRGKPEDWECPICCLKPFPAVLSTCDICSGDMCMKCFVEMFEKSCGKILCPFCRDDIGAHDLSRLDVTRIAARLRADYGLTL
mgnify:CR=1 FL=1